MPAVLIILITHIIVAVRWMLIKILSMVITLNDSQIFHLFSGYIITVFLFCVHTPMFLPHRPNRESHMQ